MMILVVFVTTPFATLAEISNVGDGGVFSFLFFFFLWLLTFNYEKLGAGYVVTLFFRFCNECWKLFLVPGFVFHVMADPSLDR